MGAREGPGLDIWLTAAWASHPDSAMSISSVFFLKKKKEFAQKNNAIILHAAFVSY